MRWRLWKWTGWDFPWDRVRDFVLAHYHGLSWRN
jgi:hypothetical protein